MAHLNLGFIFIAYFIPAVILKDQNDYANDTVSLYTLILGVGAICFIIGLYSGFLIKPIRASNFSFSFLDADVYKQRIVKITAQFFNHRDNRPVFWLFTDGFCAGFCC